MRRYCDIPVEKMSNLDKIVAIANRISIFGGTSVYPKFGEFTMAFFEPISTRLNNLYIYHIGGMGITFCGVGTIKKNGDITPSVEHYRIPLNNFSDKYLGSILLLYKKTCKEQLTEDAYKAILHEIGE